MVAFFLVRRRLQRQAQHYQRLGFAEKWLEIDIRDGREHALVDGEHQIGNAWASNGWSAQNIHISKIIECANVLSSLVRKGERITPEKPLEADDRSRHDGKP
jgi:hypothetical protein